MSHPYITTCVVCSKEKKSKFRGGIYCSNKCQHVFQSEEKYAIWISGNLKANNYGSSIIKKMVIERDSYKCSECSLTEWKNKPIVLELEHKNGIGGDNTPENVCLLCPNCHSQTSTFKGRNMGNGRLQRRLRYKRKEKNVQIQ